MADNIQRNVTSGGEDVATDDIGGVHYQRVKVNFGADGSSSDVSGSNPLPVTQTESDYYRDAFGRLRMSGPVTEFDSKLLGLDKAPLFWDEQLESGSGIAGSTPSAAKPYIDFTSTLSTAGVYTRQTRRRFNYQPGKSQLVLMTGVLDLSGGGTGVQRRIGYFDDDNGLFFEDDEATIKVVVRSNDTGTPTDTKVAQLSWNIDAMDGTGASGITVDWTKAQIFVIDFQWLSVGRVRFGLEVGGAVYYAHEIDQANTAAIPYMSTPNLPVRYQIVTTASSPASTMRCICCSVMTEGGEALRGVEHSQATVAHVDANVADTVYAVVGVRLKSTRLGANISMRHLSMLAETADDFEWQLIFNPTVAGTFTYSDLSDSACQTALGATANTVTGGTVMARGFGSANTPSTPDLDNSLLLGSLIDGTQDEIVLCVRPLGANSDIQGALTWREDG